MKIKAIIYWMLVVSIPSCMTLNDSSTDLGDGYIFHVDGPYNKIFSNKLYHETHIYSRITEYHVNDRFIIARQVPDINHYRIFTRSDYSTRFSIYSNYLKDTASEALSREITPFVRRKIKRDSILFKTLNSKNVTDQNSISDWEKIDVVLDSIFQINPFYVKLFSSAENFWIIDKDLNQRIGPLTIEEFKEQNRMLGTGLEFEVSNSIQLEKRETVNTNFR